ncbi:cytosolic phospholipase A2 gamma [Amia ocellicauda]|uniref:cytosolic phospholipase A2 gamma n=1 Tax=Amia ocellicauda TaxID=2972642 RepID=UPI00346477CA
MSSSAISSELAENSGTLVHPSTAWKILDDVPPIAVLGSGGGLRAMVALMGTLSEMKTQNLLDSILYLCGVSGSTWCMSALYKDKDWSSQVEKREEEMVETLTTGTVTFRNKWKRALESVDDENCSLTDIWAGIIVHDIVKKEDKQHLSSYTGKSMVNPYPIYAAVDKWRLDNKEQHDKGVWFEITCHEAGYPGYGAFVETSVFGSRFHAGEITEWKEEMDMLYLQGLCGSAIGDMRENIIDIIEWITHHIFSGSEVSKDITSSSQKGDRCGCMHCTKILLLFDLQKAFYCDEDCKPILQKIMATQEGEEYRQLKKTHKTWDLQKKEEQKICITEMILLLFNGKMCKLLMKLLHLMMNWTWGTKFNFLYQFPNTESRLPSDLVQDEKIYLVDAGLSINCAYPLVLRPERQVQLILSFDFSAGDPFKTVQKAAEYCKKNSIPFPDIPAVSEKEKACPSDCYIYRGKNTPTVMHFPLFNKVNCGDAEEIKAARSTFHTNKMSYSKEEIQALLAASKSNVRKNQDIIIAEIKSTVESVRKKKLK